MEALLREDSLRHVEAVPTVLGQHAPRPEVADALHPATHDPIRVVGEICAHDIVAVNKHHAIVGPGPAVVGRKRTAEPRNGYVAVVVSVKESRDPVEVVVCDGAQHDHADCNLLNFVVVARSSCGIDRLTCLSGPSVGRAGGPKSSVGSPSESSCLQLVWAVLGRDSPRVARADHPAAARLLQDPHRQLFTPPAAKPANDRRVTMPHRSQARLPFRHQWTPPLRATGIGLTAPTQIIGPRGSAALLANAGARLTVVHGLGMTRVTIQDPRRVASCGAGSAATHPPARRGNQLRMQSKDSLVLWSTLQWQR